MPLKKSLFDVTENSRNDIKNKGFSYEGKIFEKTMSPLLFAEEKRASVLAEMEKVVFHLIESVKDIKLFFDYRKRKGYRDFN
jgi:hypothetical protein